MNKSGKREFRYNESRLSRVYSIERKTRLNRSISIVSGTRGARRFKDIPGKDEKSEREKWDNASLRMFRYEGSLIHHWRRVGR